MSIGGVRMRGGGGGGGIKYYLKQNINSSNYFHGFVYQAEQSPMVSWNIFIVQLLCTKNEFWVQLC